jgi:hypothetical protein
MPLRGVLDRRRDLGGVAADAVEPGGAIGVAPALVNTCGPE